MALDDTEVTNRSAYEQWVEGEGIPILRGFYVQDIRRVELSPWRRVGGKGVFLNLEGTGEVNDSYISEIPPAGSLRPQRHIFEELIYVVEGSGATTVRAADGPERTFEWHEGALFSPPLNTWHQHFNGQGNRPARLFAMTNAPTVINLFHNGDFVMNNDYVFRDRYDGQADFFSGRGRLYQVPDLPGHVWESNFVSDVKTFRLMDYQVRGAGGTNIKFELCDNTMGAHVSEFPVGTYKKAHRHGPGAHVVIVSGEGYSLMWPEGSPIQRFDWQEGSVIVPPEKWFHQHFNTGKNPARYLALRPWGRKHPSRLRKYRGTVDVKEGGDQIEYRDEVPLVRTMFAEELARKGIESGMARFYQETI